MEGIYAAHTGAFMTADERLNNLLAVIDKQDAEMKRLRGQLTDFHNLDDVAEIRRLRTALEHIAAFPKMRQASRITAIMRYARSALDVSDNSTGEKR
jgi:hypothetical protein